MSVSDVQPEPESYPQKRLNPLLVKEVRGHAMSRTLQAKFVGFHHVPNLTHILYAPTLVVTPRLLERVERLAALVGFEGELFVEPLADEEAGR